MRLGHSGARMRGGCARWALQSRCPCGPRGQRRNRKSLGPVPCSPSSRAGRSPHAACWGGLWGAGGQRQLPLQGLQGVADERPLQHAAELLRGADAHPLPAAPGRQHGGHGSRATPGLGSGARRQGRWRAAHATPRLGGPAVRPGLHDTSRERWSPRWRREPRTGANTSPGPRSRVGVGDERRPEDAGRWSQVLLPAGMAELSSRPGPAPQAVLSLPAHPSLPPGRPC